MRVFPKLGLYQMTAGTKFWYIPYLEFKKKLRSKLTLYFVSDISVHDNVLL